MTVGELITALSRMDKTAEVFCETKTWPLRILRVVQDEGTLEPGGPKIREVAIVAEDLVTRQHRTKARRS